MSCTVCSAVNEEEFATEIMVHFSGFNQHQNPGVMAFPMIWVCLDCGASRFKMPTKELRLLREGDARSGAA